MTNETVGERYPDGYYKIHDEESGWIGYVFNGILGDDKIEWFLEEGYEIDPVVVLTPAEHDALDATIATQAARIVELERMSEFWKRAALLAMDEFVERGDELDKLRAELAEATGQLLTWHYDSKGEWGFPLSEEVWEKNPLRQRYKDLTGADWIEPVEKDVDDDEEDE